MATPVPLITTPLIFISFLVSLAIVDLRHSALRAHYHADSAGRPSRLPRWLHRLVYRYQRLRPVDEHGRPFPVTVGEHGGGDGGGEGYYHSKQRKLMRMEAAEAFEIRNGVMVVLGVLGLAAWWAAWRAVSRGLGMVWEWCS
ncbi:hypothetical protein BT67DRAFT_437023 [Trichocladium antarcticum]|uniref:Uncharacterized protein n=1 Tax=Trichocladium antarcticum TaxID=1450529 RepID=A0AAN6UF10_9PEZI|nr:hypothetical protein BT67DRAFT_437023 [Trichocladium antarcticum]